MMRMQQPIDLPYSSATRWEVCIDSAVGEPFLSTSKDYLLELVRQHQSGTSAADPDPLRKRPKRGAKPRPSKRPWEGWYLVRLGPRRKRALSAVMAAAAAEPSPQKPC